MQYIKLGRTGLDVSPICIGAMGFGDPTRGHPTWALGDAGARPLIKHALDAGINFFDVANLYSQGTAEEILGRALKDMGNRDGLVIATKLFAPMRTGPNAMGLSRKAILTEIDGSLRRLQTDYIDLYQIHRADPMTPWEETLEALHDLVKVGKVRYLGASSMPAWQFGKALHLQRMNHWTRFVTMQDNYSLVAREEEREMLPLCVDEGVATIVYSPLARGRLARPYGEESDRSKAEPGAGIFARGTEAADQQIIEALGVVAEARGVSRAQIALAWLRRHPAVGAPIIGALKPHHIDEAIASLAITLTDEEADRLEAPYTPRMDLQTISDPKVLRKMAESTGVKTASA
ncbi:MAG: aldo/keto reductase [Kofleriaceae bacterium]